MAVLFITHPEVIADPATPVPCWSLSELGSSRMQAFAASNAVAQVSEVWVSGETKAMEAARLLADNLGVAVQIEPQLHENDRSATGYLPPDEFERVTDAFFRQPQTSIRGWERAVDAQDRVALAVDRILAARVTDGDLAIVAHGGVGTLLLCRLLAVPISRELDQPSQGHYWRFEEENREVVHGWRRFET